MQIHSLVNTSTTQAVVFEVDENCTPAGLAIELHVIVTAGTTLAVWLLEDGRALWQPLIGSG